MFMLIILIVMILPLVFFIINMVISKKMFFDREKLSSFECGFAPFSVSRLPFSINFYLLMILFLIFDIEVVYLFPFVKLMMSMMMNEILFISLMILMILYAGLEYEKKEGSLKWLF